HLLLVERLDCGEAGGGTRTGAGLAHAAGALAGADAARKGSSAAATSSPASHGAKWPASGSRTIARSSTSLSRPSSCSGSSAVSFMPQITSVGTFTDGNARRSMSGSDTVTPGGGTITFAARYQLSIAVKPPGCDHSAIYCCFSASGIFHRSTWPEKVLWQKVRQAIASTAFSNPRGP